MNIKTILLLFISIHCTSLAIAADKELSSKNKKNTREYIVTFSDDYKGKSENALKHFNKELKKDMQNNSDLTSEEVLVESSFVTKEIYNHALTGANLVLTDKQVKWLIKKKFVKSIELNSIQVTNSAVSEPAFDFNMYPTWHLDRIDSLVNSKGENENMSGNGIGKNIYVIDSGISSSNDEFTNRVGSVTSTISGGATQDCFFHGTMVASLAAGSSYGVAPSATINSIRTSDCSGNSSTSDLIEAFDWIIQYGVAKSVINYSNTISSSSIATAMQNTIADGHVVVVAAGNNNNNACTDSGSKFAPQSVILVGGSAYDDTRYVNTNYGSCVDIYAPGQNVFGAHYQHDDNSTIKIANGTSQATPIIAGIAATHWANNPSDSQYEVMAAVLESSNTGKLTNLQSNSPNKLGYVLTSSPTHFWKKTSGTVNSTSFQNSELPPPLCTASGQKYHIRLYQIGSWGGPWGFNVSEEWVCQ